MYEGCIKGPTADWFPSVFTGNSQHVIFEGLMPGTINTAQVRALGGSTGQSDWSDPVIAHGEVVRGAPPVFDSRGVHASRLFCVARTVFWKNLNFFENFASQIPEKAREYVY